MLHYNTQLTPLKMPEYGRYVQKLAQLAIVEPDDNRRQVFANSIVRLMTQLSPNVRKMEDFKQKLWNHLMYIAEYDLKVKTPYQIKPFTRLMLREKPLKYPLYSNVKYKSYGRNVYNFIQKTTKEENTENRAYMSYLIANYMKLVQKTWNNENINDILIKQDLESLSNGKLSIEEGVDLINHQRRNKNNNNNNRNKKKKFFNKNRNKRF